MPRDPVDRADDFNGKLVKVTLPNAVFVEYSYDNAQRLTGIKDSLNNTVTYTLNNAGDDEGGGEKLHSGDHLRPRPGLRRTLAHDPQHRCRDSGADGLLRL
jgi:YD repeat-containing protein